MEIGNNLQQNMPEQFIPGRNLGGEQSTQNDLPFTNSKDEAAVIIDLSPENDDRKAELKEKATEMLAVKRKMGEFKDKKGLEETTDLQIGPDIRYALKTDNINFLKRISWGPLTVAEYREVKHRISEINRTRATNNNMLKGKIIDLDQRKEEKVKDPVALNQSSGDSEAIVSISV